MLGRRPRYDDTFGVRMDLGADRKDPLAQRPVPRVAPRSAKSAVIVSQPKRLIDWLRPDKVAVEPPRSIWRLPAEPVRTTAPGPAPTHSATLRAAEDWAKERWQRMTPGNRVGFGAFIFWVLMATGLFLPALVVAIAYAVIRQSKPDGR
jgi:hypothetical protein